jgi:TolB-like protein
VTPERWREVAGVFQSALDHAPGDRVAYLDRACGADLELRREVESLLAANQGATRFLEPPTTATPRSAAVDLTAPLATALAGRYNLERELGRGGMATVYLAHDLKHDRPVALKVMHPDLRLGAGLERFLREVRTAARLDHPHILAVHDSGEVLGLPWYTMPYLDGESLRHRLERGGPLPVDEAVRLARETADALECAHQHGVVHRDVKPENILLGGGHARVADFGIAQALAAVGDGRLTATGVSVGTPAYMSPEQAAGARALDGRSDVYSLGCVLYELLTGEPPFTGSTPQAVIGRRFVESPPLVRLARPAVSTAVEAALATALAREPSDRFQTAAEFRDALTLAGTADARDLSASGAGLETPPRAARERSGRRWWLLPARIALAAAAILLGLGVFFAWRQGRVAPRPHRIVVLPFENIGDSAEAYFTDGITNEVRGKLSQVSGLSVIARASSNEYRRTTKAPQQIARELGADYLLTATVQWMQVSGEPSRVRVNPELVRVERGAAPTTKWQQPFEASLTDIFQVQADIADRVASALNVALGDSVRHELAARPTESLAAYDAYLKGEAASQAMAAQDPASLRRAIGFYQQAVAMDSGFVLAWAQLARARAVLYVNATPTPELAAQARYATERAQALGPERPEGQLALGEYYRDVIVDNRKALEAFERGLKLSPTNVDLLVSATLPEQALGRWQSALEHLKRAAELDPRSGNTARRMARVLTFLRRYPEAQAAAERGLAIAPTSLTMIEERAMVSLAQGDLAGARSVIRAAAALVDPRELVAFFGTYLDLFWALDDTQQQLLLTLPLSSFDNDRLLQSIVRAQTYALRKDLTRTAVYADSARLATEEQLRATPQDGQRRVVRGLALAYLGRKAEAIAEGKRGVALLPVSRDALAGTYIQHQLIRIYLLVGEPEQALDQIEALLKVPYYLSPGWLTIDPTFEPLRRHPRFRRLVEGQA